VAFYIVATVAFAHAVIFEHPKRARIGIEALGVAIGIHGGALTLRWIAAGHGPYMMKYEVLSSNVWIAAVLLTIFLVKRPKWTAISLVVLPVMILTVGLALFTNPDLSELPPTLRSIWLTFHIAFNKLAAGSFLLSLGSAVTLLIKERRGPVGWLASVPDVDALEAYTARFIGFAFIFWTVTIAAGAIWAHESWGRYWGWDPIETWSLITWLCYGSYLHVRFFFKPRPTRSAWFAIACFIIAILAIFILPFAIPSLHSAYFQ
jgi:cytochrome c-type biogenesis protein CcsB